jgi:biotin carboxylase
MSSSARRDSTTGPSTLVVGCGFRLLDGLRHHHPDRDVLVVEHRQLVDRRGLRDRVAEIPAVADLIATTTVYDADPGPLLAQLPTGAIRRVIPGTDEQSVIASAGIAAALGLPGVGPRPAEVFADKLLLRRAAQAAALTNPRWYEVNDADDLAAKVRVLDADEFVLKPSGRSGSQGVLLLDRADDLAHAWALTTSARGRMRVEPPPPTRYMIEERLHGREVSVECLAADGEVVFANVTAKRVLPGRHPVETGHVLPAGLDAGLERELREAMRVLVKATDFGTGVLHGEWIVTAGGPALVECAARIPGDRITDLLTLAYGVPFVASYAELLTGGGFGPCRAARIGLPATARQAAAIRFLTPPPGTVQRVAIPEGLRRAPDVPDVGVDVSVGDVVGVLRASADRVGWVQAVGPDAGAAMARAAEAADSIQIVTR